MIIACATDDEIMFCSRHFGDAKYYLIYNFKKDSIDFIGKIKNTTGKEKEYSSPKKAKNIVSILKDKNVEVVLSKVFGPNIKKIIKFLLPILSNTNLIEDSLISVQDNYEKIEKLLMEKNNCYLNLKNNKEIFIND